MEHRALLDQVGAHVEGASADPMLCAHLLGVAVAHGFTSAAVAVSAKISGVGSGHMLTVEEFTNLAKTGADESLVSVVAEKLGLFDALLLAENLELLVAENVSSDYVHVFVLPPTRGVPTVTGADIVTHHKEHKEVEEDLVAARATLLSAADSVAFANQPCPQDYDVDLWDDAASLAALNAADGFSRFMDHISLLTTAVGPVRHRRTVHTTSPHHTNSPRREMNY